MTPFQPIKIKSSVGPLKEQLLLKLIRRPDFLLAATLGIFILANIYYGLILRTATLQMLVDNMANEPVYFALLSFLAPITLLLFGLNFGLALTLYRARGGTPGLGGTFFGALVGAFGVGCPACGAFLLSLVGVTAGLAVLPFGGLELWVIAGAVMAATAWKSVLILDQQTCDPKLGMADCWHLPKNDQRLNLIMGFISLLLAISLVMFVWGNEAFI